MNMVMEVVAIAIMVERTTNITKGTGIMIIIILGTIGTGMGMGTTTGGRVYPGYYYDPNLYFYGGPSINFEFSAVPSESSIDFANPGDRFWHDSDD